MRKEKMVGYKLLGKYFNIDEDDIAISKMSVLDSLENNLSVSNVMIAGIQKYGYNNLKENVGNNLEILKYFNAKYKSIIHDSRNRFIKKILVINSSGHYAVYDLTYHSTGTLSGKKLMMYLFPTSMSKHKRITISKYGNANVYDVLNSIVTDLPKNNELYSSSDIILYDNGIISGTKILEDKMSKEFTPEAFRTKRHYEIFRNKYVYGNLTSVIPNANTMIPVFKDDILKLKVNKGDVISKLIMAKEYVYRVYFSTKRRCILHKEPIMVTDEFAVIDDEIETIVTRLLNDVKLYDNSYDVIYYKNNNWHTLNSKYFGVDINDDVLYLLNKLYI